MARLRRLGAASLVLALQAAWAAALLLALAACQPLPRPLAGHELSDGTLQFICLAAMLCSPKPPPLLVLNEPETSLNEAVYPALADLVAHAARHSQIIIVSHSRSLCDAIAAECQIKTQELTMRYGETRLRGQEHSRTCIVLDDEEDE